MTVKLFEVRDAATTIICMGIEVNTLLAADETEFKMMRHAGYGERCILFCRLQGGEIRFDPYEHTGGARTIPNAHLFVEKHWDMLKSGDIVDVQFILGETDEPKETDL
jgi:hypothetical protein